MKIAFANKFWYLKGGAERYAFDLAALLESRGHSVFPFAMRDARNEQAATARHFVSPVQTERVRFTPDGIRTAARSLWSFESKRRFGALLDEHEPDMVHVHNIYRQISPSILGAAAKRGVPVVMTVHDYALIAPNYSLYHDGRICEVTKPDAFWNAVQHRCVKGSRAASALVAAEMALHRTLGAWKHVRRFIAPSRFVQSLLAEYGVPEARITHVPHFIDAASWTPSFGTGDYALYVGRLTEDKGIGTLLKAAALAKDVPVRIVGTGPDESRLKAMAREIGAKNVVFAGFKKGEALRKEYAGARFLVVPSEWYEVFGLIALEAYASGKPVIASQIGGLAELVRDGETGLYASAGDAQNLAEQMRMLWANPAECERMGRAGRAWVEREFTPEQHYARIMEVYGEAIG